MLKLAGPLNRYPARVTSLGFAVLILVGTGLLYGPWTSANAEKPLTLLDAFFMATSGVCVTGLSVRSLANEFTVVGQIIMLLLIQIGGLGIMTLTTFVLLASGTRGGLRHHLVITSTIAGQSRSDLRKVLRSVFLLTMFSEFIGFVILFFRFLFEMPFLTAFWNALFLSVSAFCNAGFALDDRSLIAFQRDPTVIITIASLIIVGGIGYPVLFDVAANLKRSKRVDWVNLHLHSKLTILGTVLLLVGGFLSILGLEWNNPSFEGESTWFRIITAAFQSVTCRTAGFNSVDLTRFGNGTLIVMMLLMLIGAGPCSTAGGMKVTTFLMLVVHAMNRFRGRQNVTMFRRTIPQIAIDRAMATTMLFFSVGAVASIALLSLEQIGQTRETQRFQFLQIVFEVVSAMGTVGLSINDTYNMTTASKLVLVALMFVGRLGPISFFSALANSPGKAGLQYASEEPITG